MAVPDTSTGATTTTADSGERVVQDTLSLTLSGLEAGLHVRHITTFDLHFCVPMDDAEEVLARAAPDGFDQIPVRENGRIVGVLERGHERVAGTVHERMRLLDDTLLISAEAPLARFLRLASANPYRLVVADTGIRGIVTRSDLIKLPVRLFAFTLLTHLESLMSSAIRAAHPSDDGWLDHLSANERHRVLREQARRERDRLDPSLLECTTFSQKRDALAGSLNLDEQSKGELNEIKELRNTIAHGNDYAGSALALQHFLARFRLTEEWIARLDSTSGR